jgi:hypothetical protein
MVVVKEVPGVTRDAMDERTSIIDVKRKKMALLTRSLPK